MEIEVTKWQEEAAALVAAMDLGHHTQYHVVMTPGEAVAYIRRLKSYNYFNSGRAEWLIHEVVSIAPPVPYRNGPDVEFVVGCEGSQVIYACVSTHGNKLYDDFQFQGWFVQEMERIGRDARADESNRHIGHPFWGSESTTHFCWRFWWD